MPGPAPNPNARRRNVRPNTTQLPAEGYRGTIPEWPLTLATKAESDAWKYFWSLPQASAWAQMRLSRTVARYVRAVTAAERPGAAASVLTEARQLEDRLGLTPMSMLRLRWEVVSDELTERRDEPTEVANVRRLFSAG